ncbi:MAG: hypothetical protein ACM3JB_27040 [Acidobacteriaceae bacterium]
MSFRLVDRIKKTDLPGKYKRVLEAWVSFGNKDGTSIRPSKEAVAKRAGISRRTVYRRTDDLIAVGILVPESDENGNERRHYYGNGHYATVYHINAEALCQKDTLERLKQYDKTARGQCDISSKTNVPERHATRPSNPFASLRDNQTLDDRSAVSTAVESKTVSKIEEPSSVADIPDCEHAIMDDETFGQMDFDNNSKALLRFFKPVLNETMVKKSLPVCRAILEALRGTDFDAWDLIAWNRAHRSHKFASKQDKAMYLRRPEQMLKALTSENGSLLNEYDLHDFDGCDICNENRFRHTRDRKAENARIMVEKKAERLREMEAEAEARRRAEEERRKQDRWSRYDFTEPPEGRKNAFAFNRSFKAEDARPIFSSKTNSNGRAEVTADSKAALDATINWFFMDGSPFDIEDFRRVYRDALECWNSKSRDAV